MQLLDELIGERAAKDWHCRPDQRYAKVLPHLDLELTTVQHDGDGRTSAAQDIGNGSARGTCSAGRGFADAALEDARPDPALAEGHVPGDVGAVGKLLAALDRGTDRGEIQRFELALVLHSDHALRISDLHMLKAPPPSPRHELSRPVAGTGGVVA